MRINFNPIIGKFDFSENEADKINITDSGGYYTGKEVETALEEIGAGTTLDTRYLKISNNLSDLGNAGTARTNLGLIAGGGGDIWVEKAGDISTGGQTIQPTVDTLTALVVNDTDSNNVLTVDTVNNRVVVTSGTTGQSTIGAGLIVNNDSGSGAINDFQVNSDTLTALFVDASANTLAIGVNTTIADGKNIVLNTTTGTKIGASDTAKLAFYNSTPIVQPTVLTTQLTTVTFTAPGTPDYAIADLTTTTPYGFVSADEGQTVLSVIANLQTRVSELETKLQSLGLLA